MREALPRKEPARHLGCIENCSTTLCWNTTTRPTQCILH
ncbi:hypothetical protein M3J09_012216 [Ascochyta lentis]